MTPLQLRQAIAMLKGHGFTHEAINDKIAVKVYFYNKHNGEVSNRIELAHSLSDVLDIMGY